MPVVAKETVRVAGYRQMLRGGRLYEDNDPVVKARPDLFESPEDYQRRKSRPQSTAELGDRSAAAWRMNVESGRAAPGELRSIDYPCPHEGCDFRGTSERSVKTHVTKVHS